MLHGGVQWNPNTRKVTRVGPRLTRLAKHRPSTRSALHAAAAAAAFTAAADVFSTALDDHGQGVRRTVGPILLALREKQYASHLF